MKLGVDLSYHQGTIDFNKVKAAGVKFVIARTGYGVSTVDKKFHEYVKASTNAKIPVIGVYHFSYALTAEQAVEEAKFCIKQVEKAGLSKNIIIFFDFEYDTVNYAAKRNVKLGKKECNNHAKAFCEYVTSAGYKAGIYYNIDYYKRMYDHTLLAKYYNWLADYNGGPDYPCYIQQYTASGRVNGINAKVDLNYLFEEENNAKQKDIEKVAKEVIAGKWGVGEARMKSLVAAGYDYDEVQAKVNALMKKQTTTPATTTKPATKVKEVTASGMATKFDKKLAGSYKTTASLHCRDDASTSYKTLKVIPKGTIVKNYGYYKPANGGNWLYVQCTLGGITYTGFCYAKYLKK